MVQLGHRNSTHTKENIVKLTRLLIETALIYCECTIYDPEVKAIAKAFRRSNVGTDEQNFAYSLCRALCRVRGYYSKEEFDIFLPLVTDAIEDYT